MRRLTEETAVAGFEVEQMVMDYWQEVDVNHAADIKGYFTDDCRCVMGPYTLNGPDEVVAFYAERIEIGRTEFPPHGRTAYHSITNLRVNVDSNERASANFLSIAYSAPGKTPPPILNATVPVSVGKVRFEFRREADGQWRIFEFEGSSTFLGGDDYVKKALKADESLQRNR